VGLSDFLIKPFLYKPWQRVQEITEDPIGCQSRVLANLVSEARFTLFGRHHHFESINSYNDFKNAVPIRTYEALLDYLQKAHRGESDILWKGKPRFWGKTSGTTSRTKYIPVTNESLKNQLQGPMYAPANIANRENDIDFLKGRVLLFSDGHFFEDLNGIPAAPISTIANSQVPFIYKWWQMPSDKINSIANYQARMSAMVKACEGKDIRTIAAMPVWFIAFLRHIEKESKKKFEDLFPKFRMLLVSGMDYTPYESEIKSHIKKPFNIYESYPSTEGFIAYQDRNNERGMQLVLNNGIFFEFIELDKLNDPSPVRVSLEDVKTGVQYALVLNTNAGLWGYLNGDTIRFVSLYPHRITITGRIHHYISAFGEHVTSEETDKALGKACEVCKTSVAAYTVAPFFPTKPHLPSHEWFIEFGNNTPHLELFKSTIEKTLCELNFAYADLVRSKAIDKPRIRIIPQEGFETYLKKTGRTGLQQKVPSATNNYKLAAEIIKTLNL